jgi:hypothetical protein
MSIAIGSLGGRDVVVSGGDDGTVAIARPGDPAHQTIDTGVRGSVKDVLIGPDSMLVIGTWHSLTVVQLAQA